MEQEHIQPKKAISILIAEDSRTQAERLSYLLEQHDYRVIVTPNGREALQRAREEHPDLLISDIVMPEMNGYELCKAIKSDDALKDTPVILVTTLSNIQDVVRGLECGADNFIRKPYDENYLLSRINYLLMNMELHSNHKMRIGVEIRLAGQKYFITSERQQILDLLISTYEQAIYINEELKLREQELDHSNRVLQGLYRIAEGLNRVSSEQEVAQIALERAMEIPGVQGGWICMSEGESDFRVIAMHNLPLALTVPGALDFNCTCRMQLISGNSDSPTNIECEHLAKVNGDTHGHTSVPLWLGGHAVGLMNLIGPKDGLFDEEELKVLNGVGNQVAIALERAHLYANLEQLVEQRTAALTKETRERKRVEQEQARLAAIIEATPDFVGTATMDGKPLYINRAGRTMRGLPLDSALLPAHVRENHPAWVEAIMLEKALPAAIENGSWVGETAIVGEDGREIPVLQVIIAHKNHNGTVEYISTLARDITEQKEQQRRIQRLNRVYAVLSGINTTIVRVHDRETLFNEACRIAVEHGKFRMAWIGLLDTAREIITPASWAGHENGYLDVLDLYFRDKDENTFGPSKIALRNKQFFIINDIEAYSKQVPWRESALQHGYRSVVSLPLFMGDQLVGVYSLYAAEKDFFDTEEMKLLNEVAGDISFALDHLEKESRVNYLAYYDELTDLPNRTLFIDHLNQFLHEAGENNSSLALAVIDLDHFRFVNEIYGRYAGDDLLKQVASRLLRVGLGRHRLARVGANTFALVLDGFENASDVAFLLEHQILNQFIAPFTVDDKELSVSAKAGVALFPADGKDPETLFHNAEAALKNSKSGGEKYLFYTPEINASVAEKLTLESKLRRAIEQEQFVLYYQPKVNLKDGQIVGLEALIRWNDPDGGMVSPAKFIPLLEETGMILEVGRWALEKTIADTHRWIADGLQPPRTAVNVSQVQLRQKDFVNVVEKILNGSDKARQYLDLEITESLIMHDVESNIEKLGRVREMGVEVAVDDFGTGYSSLSYIAKLPVTALKVDRAFIIKMTESPDDLNIVSTIISLGHALDMLVIAEGVETKAQADLLRLLKCDVIQGFLFSPAVPAEQISEFLRENRKMPV